MQSDNDYDYKPRKIEDMSDRFFRFGQGRISGAASIILGVLSFLAVLSYQFPEYLTTPELRAAYDAKQLQLVLMITMWASLGFGLLTFILARHRKQGAIGVLFTLAAFAIGGYTRDAQCRSSATIFEFGLADTDLVGVNGYFYFSGKNNPQI